MNKFYWHSLVLQVPVDPRVVLCHVGINSRGAFIPATEAPARNPREFPNPGRYADKRSATITLACIDATFHSTPAGLASETFCHKSKTYRHKPINHGMIEQFLTSFPVKLRNRCLIQEFSISICRAPAGNRADCTIIWLEGPFWKTRRLDVVTKCPRMGILKIPMTNYCTVQ